MQCCLKNIGRGAGVLLLMLILGFGISAITGKKAQAEIYPRNSLIGEYTWKGSCGLVLPSDPESCGSSASDSPDNPPPCLAGFEFTVVNSKGVTIYNDFIDAFEGNPPGSTEGCAAGCVQTCGSTYEHTFVITPQPAKEDYPLSVNVVAVKCNVLNKSCPATVRIDFEEECGNRLAGDVNGDGQVDIQDVVDLLGALYSGDTPPCMQNADFNGDGQVDLTDVQNMLEELFLSG